MGPKMLLDDSADPKIPINIFFSHFLTISAHSFVNQDLLFSIIAKSLSHFVVAELTENYIMFEVILSKKENWVIWSTFDCFLK